ncbi:MAG: molybdopterin cofactor-binding domain-containing protein [Dokdonella sp.]
MSPDSGKPMLPSRRQFLATSASLAGGLVIACFVPFGTRRLFAQEGGPPPAPPMDPNAFVHIGSDDSVTVVLKHSEMGQGVWTSIPMVIAEELDCDWSKVRVENAPNAQVYANNAFGIQGTGGSTSTLESFGQMREAGAMARVAGQCRGAALAR